MIKAISPVIKIYRDKKHLVQVFVKKKPSVAKNATVQNKVDILV